VTEKPKYAQHRHISMRELEVKLAEVLVVLLLLALTIGGLWLGFAGPCEVYAWQRAGDVPVRCLR
jgi:hypothetical protein